MRTFSIAAFVFLTLALGYARGAGFTASLDRDTISMGESATLSLTFEGGQPHTAPSPDVPGLQINNTGYSFNNVVNNGQVSSALTITYSVTPEHVGEFQIPALVAIVNGQRVSSQPLKLTVQKATPPSAASVNAGNEIAFLKLEAPQQKIYSGETFAGQLKLFLRDDVQSFGNFQFTGNPADGVSVGKMVEGNRFRTQVGNRVYTVVPISFVLTATRSGEVSLGPFTAKLVVVLPSQNQGGDPFFQFFNQGVQKPLSLASDEVKIQSLPLPSENVPTNFEGAIGDYQMTVTAGPTNVTVGDPITVRVQVAGRGSFDAVKLPPQPGWDGFKIFTPTSRTETSDALGLEGTKTFEEIVTPEKADLAALPPFSFSYFNPDDGRYHTLVQPAEHLIVRAGGATPLPTIAGNNNSAGENPTPADILPIKNDLGTIALGSAPLVTRPVFVALQSVPVLAFIGALVWRRRADSLANNPRLRRRRAVAQLLAGGLSDLNKFASENKAEEFFAMLFRLLQEQLGERLDCPAISITEADVDARLVAMGAGPALLESLRELFQYCDQARYAPIQTRQELTAIAGKFKNVVDQFQDLKG